MSVLLENQARQLVNEANTLGASGAGTSISAGQSEAWAGVALPLVRRVFGEIVSKDLVSVQPMNLPSGLIFYLDFQYGSAQPGFAAGDTFGDTGGRTNKIVTVNVPIKGSNNLLTDADLEGVRAFKLTLSSNFDKFYPQFTRVVGNDVQFVAQLAAAGTAIGDITVDFQKGWTSIPLQHQCYGKHLSPERILVSIEPLTYEFSQLQYRFLTEH